MKNKRISISKLIELHGKENRYFWKKLSNDWVHTKGLVEKIIEPLLSQNSEFPSSWSLYFPAEYSRGDLIALGELKKDISFFRNLLCSKIS